MIKPGMVNGLKLDKFGGLNLITYICNMKELTIKTSKGVFSLFVKERLEQTYYIIKYGAINCWDVSADADTENIGVLIEMYNGGYKLLINNCSFELTIKKSQITIK